MTRERIVLLTIIGLLSLLVVVQHARSYSEQAHREDARGEEFCGYLNLKYARLYSKAGTIQDTPACLVPDWALEKARE